MQNNALGYYSPVLSFCVTFLQFVSKPVSKNPRAFGIIVEGNLLDNFGIQSLEHFYLKY
jgi:hypothetical protein